LYGCASLASNLSLVSIFAVISAAVVIGDFATGVFHWSVDNYGSIDTPLVGTVCAAFQGHHDTPWTITFRSFANNVFKIW
jgi:ubiquitin-conjugating enzyme E2 variant